MSEADYDETPSEVQADWQQLARRLRMQIDHTLATVERDIAKGTDGDCLQAVALENLCSAAMHAFVLERQAASMDSSVRRELKGW